MRLFALGARRALLAVALATLLIAGACGSDDDDAGGSGDSNTEQPDGKTDAGSNVPGVTDEVIRVGLMNIDQEAAEDVAGEVSGGKREYAPATYENIGNAVAEHINANGGIAGRKLELVFYKVNAQQLASAEGRRQESQRACATFTEDNEVFAFAGPLIGLTDIFYDCAKTAGAMLFPVPGGLPVDEQLQKELGDLWFNPTKMLADRRNENLVENLVRRGVLKKGDKAAILYEDRAPTKRSVEGAMVEALEDNGVEVVAKAAYPDPLQSPWDTYVVQFKGAGATHVLFGPSWDGLGLPVFMTMNAAQEQGFKPTWGLASDNQPTPAAANGAPREQLAKTFVMGVEPAADTGAFLDSETRTRCNDIAQKKNIQSTATFEAELDVQYVCDNLLFLWAAVNQADEVSPAGVAKGVGELKDRYRSAFTIDGRTSFASKRHDGLARQRDLVFDEQCTDEGVNCWKYEGESRALD